MPTLTTPLLDAPFWHGSTGNTANTTTTITSWRLAPRNDLRARAARRIIRFLNRYAW